MKNTFRFKLNLFDSIVLVIGLCLIAVLGWLTLKPADTAAVAGPTAQTFRYIVQFETALEGTGEYIQPGDQLVDSIRNYKIGTVESVEVRPALVKTLNEDDHTVTYAETAGFEDVFITVVVSGTLGENAVVLDGGYSLRVNDIAYIRGEGYVGYGPVIFIERGEK